jgi:UDP-N-acetylmuramate dehydrogenase
MLSSQVNLKNHTTFGVDVFSSRFGTFSTIQELTEALTHLNNEPLLILGGGSNLLMTKNFDGLTLKNEIKGVEELERTENNVVLKVGAGEAWHEFVQYCVERNFAGVENLSLIPGNVGASPMQNIGAYGVEVKDVIKEVHAYHIENNNMEIFSNEACEFGYRESVFKRKLKGQYVITHVVFELKLNATLNTSYGAIETELATKGITQPTLKDVSEAVIAIRQSKLPDPKLIGNAGSFFKNPVVAKEVVEQIKLNYPSIPTYPIDATHVKVPAGWLIEQAGWKGKTFENYGVHKNQALVLVNYGGATGKQIWDLSTDIVNDIHQKFGIELEREVNIV